MTPSVSPADLGKVVELLRAEGNADAAIAVQKMATRIDEQLKAEHLESLGGTEKAEIGWNAVKEIRPNLDGVLIFNDLPYGKKVEYATFAHAVDQHREFYSISVGERVMITGPLLTARGYAVENFAAGEFAYVRTLPDNDGDVVICNQRGDSYTFNSLRLKQAHIKVTSLRVQESPF